ncbi:hypothetical protein ENUP19_0044G0007 [Entamoeba nuttalli]
MVDIDYKSWLQTNYEQQKFFFVKENEQTIVNLLKTIKNFESYIFLTFNTYAIVISVDTPESEERTLQHYKDSIILNYESVLSQQNLPGHSTKLRLAKVSFVETKKDLDVKETNLIEQTKGTEHAQYEIKKITDTKWKLIFSWKNVDLKEFLYKIALVCKLREICINESSISIRNIASVNRTLVGEIVIEGEQLGKELKRESFLREFISLREMGNYNQIGKDLVETHYLSVSKCSLLQALSVLAEQFLCEINETMFTERYIQEAFCFHSAISKLICDAFYNKFNPKNVREDIYNEKIALAKEAIENIDSGKYKHDKRRKIILSFIVSLVEHILKTNFFCIDKLAIGFRLSPHFLDQIPEFDRTTKYPELPFGIFFIYNKNFFGFQIRFRDLARGGLRTVINKDMETALFQKTNMFGECYNLAYTQQKKNKDIPEGGSKGIIFLYPNNIKNDIEIIKKKLILEGCSGDIEEIIKDYEDKAKNEYLYSMQKCFLNTFLTLIVANKDGTIKERNIVDYYKHPEYIYLGPDENMHDCMIEWLANESKRMDYFAKGAFISGKEETGINHKEYGVTSIGVFEYVKLGLDYLKLNNYTMKITGGPNGDVAGNLIHLVKKEHTERCKITSISSSVCAILDSQGIDINELDQLFLKGKALQYFNTEKLHDDGYMIRIDQKRTYQSFVEQFKIYNKKNGKVEENWIEANKGMKLYETTVHQNVVDVFCPCGGRPYTLNENNVQNFLVNGKPTAKMIVEGANLYLTPKARDILEKSGVLIFKDSSANKCGVVSSSYEILGGLALDDDQFIAIKKQYAKEILKRLVDIAQGEGNCMLQAYDAKYNSSLVSISEEISRRINEYTDRIQEFLSPLNLFETNNKKYLNIYIKYIPECLNPYKEQLMTRIPQMHMKAIIATSLATHLVYSKGLGWHVSIIDILPNLL